MSYSAGKQITIENFTGQMMTTAWDCCHKEAEARDVAGVTAFAYVWNGENRMVLASNAQAVYYDYSPFGGIVLQTGSLADTFTHRFSTKPWCGVTGLYEYQFRKYSPVLGRWMSRDPIEDHDNYYAIVNTLNVIDTLGLYRFKDKSCDCYKTDIDNAFSSVHKALSTIPKYETKRKQEGKPKTRLDELVDIIKGYYNDLGITPVHKKFSTSKDLDNLLKDFNSRATSGRMVPSLDCCPSTNEKMHPCNLNGNAAAVTKSDEIHLCCEGVNNPAPYGGLDCIVIHEMLHKIIHSTHEQEMTGENLQNERLVVRISTLFMGKQCPVPAYSETGQ